ncbi:hypothetical protein BGZ94_006929 [Podila epigama]|nr:hypothetical protein BGZ94_006929 [Podila epigama]
MNLDPLCYITNKDYIYSVSLASWKDEKYVVVSRVRLSQKLSTLEKWEMISINSMIDFGSGYLSKHRSSTTCSAGLEGVIYVHTMGYSSPETLYLDTNNLSDNGYYSFTYKTCKNEIAKRGRWEAESTMPSFTNHMKRLIVRNMDTRKPDAMVLYSYLEEQVSRPTTPQIYVSRLDPNIKEQDQGILRAPIVLTNATGAMYEMAYGDKMLSALIREPSETSSGTSWQFAKRTLAFLRLETPYNMTDIKKSVVSIPWDDECPNAMFSSSGASAVANGKFYYMCEVSQRSSESVRLYIYDTKTNSTKSFRYSSDVLPVGKITLVYKSDSTQGDDPENILDLSNKFLSLPQSDTPPGALLSHSSGAQMATSTDFETICGFSKADPKSYGNLVIGVLASLLVAALITVLVVKRRRKAARMRAEQTGLPGYEESMDRNAATSFQGGNAMEMDTNTGPRADEELPAYTRYTRRI